MAGRTKRAAAAKRASALAEKVANAEAAIEAETAALNAREADRVRLGRTAEALEERLARLSEELTGVASERQGIAPSAEDEAALSEAQGALDAALRNQETLEAEALKAEQARAEAVNKERAAREALQAVERELGILEAEAEAIARLLQIERSDLWPPMIDAIKVASGFEIALGAALGEDLSAPTDEAAPVHWRTLPPLADGQPLPSGAKPLTELVDAPPALHRRLSQIGLVDSVEAGSAMQSELKVGQRLVTRAGDLWRWDGYMASANAPTPAAKRLEQRNRSGELQARLPGVAKRAGDARATYHIAREAAEAAQDAEIDRTPPCARGSRRSEHGARERPGGAADDHLDRFAAGRAGCQ